MGIRPWVADAKRYAGDFDEAKHPRGPKGTPEGGKFVPKMADDWTVHNEAYTKFKGIQAPKGFGGFGLAVKANAKGELEEMYVLCEVPREVRHPEDYGGDRIERSEGYRKWGEFEDKVFDITNQLSAKLGIPVEALGNISGPGVKILRKPGVSKFHG